MRHEWKDPECEHAYHVEDGKLYTHAFAGGPIRTDPDGFDGEVLLREVARLAEENRALKERAGVIERADRCPRCGSGLPRLQCPRCQAVYAAADEGHAGPLVARIAALEAEVDTAQKTTIQTAMDRIRELSALQDRVRALEAEVERLRAGSRTVEPLDSVEREIAAAEAREHHQSTAPE